MILSALVGNQMYLANQWSQKREGQHKNEYYLCRGQICGGAELLEKKMEILRNFSFGSPSLVFVASDLVLVLMCACY